MFQFLKEQFESAAQKVAQSGIIQGSSVLLNSGVQLENSDINETQNEAEPKFQTQLYKKYLKTKVLQCLDQFSGKKVLVTDQSVGELMSLVFDSLKVLREHGIEEIYYIDSDELQVDLNQVVFFVRPLREYMKRINRIIKQNQMKSDQKSYMLVFCPRSTIICREYLEKEGIMGNLQLKNCNFDLIPLENDLLCLEYNDCLQSLYLNKDNTVLNLVAESIQRMQVVHGKFKNIYSKGDHAKDTFEIMKQREQTIQMEDENEYKDTKLNTLFIFDRSIDLVTPFCTAFSYEALVDEFFQIKQNCITLDPEVIKKGALPKDKKKVMKLTKYFDHVFEQIKSFNIKKVVRFLEQKRNINKSIMQSKDEQRSMEQMATYLEKIKFIQKEHNHVLDHYIVSQYIVEELDQILFNVTMTHEAHSLLQVQQQKIELHIENMIAISEPLDKVLKLLILNCQVNNGLKPKFYDFIKREILYTYGIRHVLTLNRLEKLNFLKYKTSDAVNWDKIKTQLRLINEAIDHDNPDDFSYVYLAYAPITVRLVQEVLENSSWRNVLQAVRELPGETIIQQNLHLSGQQKDQNEVLQDQSSGCVVVYYVGGVTYGEIACLRWLSKKYCTK